MEEKKNGEGGSYLDPRFPSPSFPRSPPSFSFARSLSLSLSLSGDYLSADQTEAAPLRYLSSNQTPSSSLTGGSGGKR